MKFKILFLFLSTVSLLACHKEKGAPGPGFEGRWILVETVNAWTSEVTNFTEENTPESFEFRADSTFTKFRTEENCSIEGTYGLGGNIPNTYILTYQGESSDCLIYFGYPPYLTLENEKLIHDARPWDGELLVYEKK